MEIKNKFKLFLGIKVGFNVFKQLIPFGAILLALAFVTSLIGSLLPSVAQFVFLLITGTCYTMLLMVKIKHLHEATGCSDKEVINEAIKCFLPAIIAASVLALIQFIFAFFIGFMMPWPPLQHALDVFLAIAFLYINHCIAIGKDSPFEAINNAMAAYSKNKFKVWFLGLFIILWKIITLIPVINDTTVLMIIVNYLIGPLLGAILLSISASHYFQMIRKENQGNYQYE